MIKVYHAQNTRSVRVVWLLEELGLDYEVKKLQFNPQELQSEKYLAIHPLGKVPSIEDDGLVLNESGAITEYILAKYGKGRLAPKAGTNEYGQYLQWVHFAEATFMPPLGTIAQHAFIRPEEKRIPALIPESQEAARKILAILDKHLKGRTFMMGEDFTAADTMIGYNLLLCKMFALLTDDYPNVVAYFERVSSRPAFKAATA